MTQEHLRVAWAEQEKDGRRKSSLRKPLRFPHGQQNLIFTSLPSALPRVPTCISYGDTLPLPSVVSVSHNCSGDKGEHQEQPRDTEVMESQDMASCVGDLLCSSEGTAGAKATEMLLR